VAVAGRADAGDEGGQGGGGELGGGAGGRRRKRGGSGEYPDNLTFESGDVRGGAHAYARAVCEGARAEEGDGHARAQRRGPLQCTYFQSLTA